MALGRMKIKKGMIVSVRQNFRYEGDGWNWQYIEYKHLFYLGVKSVTDGIPDDHMFWSIPEQKELGWYEDIFVSVYDNHGDREYPPFKVNNKARYNAEWKLVEDAVLHGDRRASVSISAMKRLLRNIYNMRM